MGSYLDNVSLCPPWTTLLNSCTLFFSSYNNNFSTAYVSYVVILRCVRHEAWIIPPTFVNTSSCALLSCHGNSLHSQALKAEPSQVVLHVAGLLAHNDCCWDGTQLADRCHYTGHSYQQVSGLTVPRPSL